MPLRALFLALFAVALAAPCIAADPPPPGQPAPGPLPPLGALPGEPPLVPAPWPPLVVEFTIPPKPGTKNGSTHEIVAGPDGALWLTQQEQARVVRVTTAGEFTMFPLPAGSGPHGIEFDRSGGLWVGLEFKNSIVRLDGAGKIEREYPIPQPKAGPHGLAVGHDGRSIWWTGKTGDVIGRLDSATGQMHLFPLPQKGAQPIYIDRGPDNSMWFTELTGNRVGRITPDGTITEFEIPGAHLKAPSARPIVVLAAKDGAMWFSAEAAHAFGKVDAEGRIAMYPLLTRTAEPAGLAFDRAGALWIQYRKPDLIARARTDMSLQEFPLKTKIAIGHRLILGPDGNMWFTGLATDTVGYVVTGAR